MSLLKSMEYNLNSNKMTEIQKYIQQRVLPILEPLQMDILALQPPNLSQFSRQWLKNRQQFSTKKNIKNYHEEDSQDEPIEEFRIKINKNRQRGKRIGISGDLSSTINSRILTVPKNQLSQQTKMKILMNLKRCVIFQNISPKNLFRIIDYVVQRKYEIDEIVIEQGDVGNQLFIVGEGLFMCSQSGNGEIQNSIWHKVYQEGQIFGELALLYNHPRALTITCSEPGCLYSLGRFEFNYIMQNTTTEKLKICEDFISKIDLFQNLNIYERSKLYESMDIRHFAKETYIIRQGDQGDCFYIVINGKAVAERKQNGVSKLVYTFKKGEYFGEIALLENVCRQASVKTVSEVDVIFIDKDTFFRLLGSLQNILKRNQKRYSQNKRSSVI